MLISSDVTNTINGWLFYGDVQILNNPKVVRWLNSQPIKTSIIGECLNNIVMYGSLVMHADTHVSRMWIV